MPSTQLLIASGGARTYATWNPADKQVNLTLSGGNLTGAVSTPNSGGVRATIGKNSGKWYWEVVFSNIPTLSSYFGCGLTLAAAGYQPGQIANSAGYIRDSSGGYLFQNGSLVSTVTAGATLGFAFDADAQTLQILVSNVPQGTLTGLSASALFPTAFIDATDNLNTFTANFGATTLTYTPPSGFNPGLYN